MNQDQNEIASEQPSEAQAVDRSQQPIVGQGFEDGVESLAKQFKYVISGLIATGGTMFMYPRGLTALSAKTFGLIIRLWCGPQTG